jgi:lysophospholipase L1-like esterase
MSYDNPVLASLTAAIHRPHHRPIKRTLLLIAAGPLLAGCLARGGAYQGPADATTVGVAGDSLVYQAEYGLGLENPDPDHFLTDVLVAAGYQDSIGATIGAATTDLAAWAIDPNTGQFVGWPTAPVVSVTALGTNDMAINTTTGLPAVSVEQAAANLQAHLNRIAQARIDQGVEGGCDVLVGVAQVPTWGLDRYGPQLNAAMQQIADVYVDWPAIVAEHPEYLNPNDPHQTAVGREAYRQAILAGVQECQT